MQQYKGASVTVLRNAQQGDEGFDASKDQSLIKLADGTNKVVPKSEVTTGPGTG